MHSPENGFLERLLALARLGRRHDPVVDSVAEVLTSSGLTGASASSLRRIRTGGGLPRGDREQLDAALQELANGHPDAPALVDELHRLFAAPRPARARHPAAVRPIDALPVPAERRAAAARFLRELDRFWIDALNRRLSQRALAAAARIRPETMARVRRLEVALPPAALWEIVGSATPEDRDVVCTAYAAAYGPLYPPENPHLKLIRRPLVAADPARRSMTVAALERASRAGLREANRLLHTGAGRAGELRLEDLYVPRRLVGNPAIRTEVELLRRCESVSVTVIVGEPGTGKTSLLWRLATRLEPTGRPVWLVPAGDLGGSIATEDIGAALRPAEPDTAGPPVLLVDTIDLHLRAGVLTPLVEDLLRAATGAGATLVMTCRPREYEALRGEAREYDIAKVDLGAYTHYELRTAVERHAQRFLADRPVDAPAIAAEVLTAVARGLPIEAICRVPLTLRMLFELHQLGRAGTWVDTEIDVTDLFERYWQLRVRTDARSNISSDGPTRADDLSLATELLAVVMLADGMPRVSRGAADRALGSLGRPPDELDKLVSRDVLHPVDVDAVEHLQHFHQSFFEYAAARAVVAAGPKTVDALVRRTLAEPDDAFLAAVTQQTLVFTGQDRHTSLAYDAAFERLLNAEPGGVQFTAVAAYAQARHRGPLTVAAGQRLLASAGPGQAQRYLYYLPRIRHDDVATVLDDLAVIWRHDGEELRTATLDALHTLALVSRDAVLDAVNSPRLDWLAWFRRLTPEAARQRRGSALRLVEELAPADPDWSAERLADIAAIVTGGKAQDALAAVLTVAARSDLRPEHLRALVLTVPDGLSRDASGIDDLSMALAGMFRRIWLSEGTDPAAIARAMLPGTAPDAEAWPTHGQAPPDWLSWPVRLRALAEFAHERGPQLAQMLLDTLLACNDPKAQSDTAIYLLRRLIEGRHRSPLPGAPTPAPDLAAELAQLRCAEALRTRAIAGTPPGARPLRDLWRDALDGAAIPPDEVASITIQVTRPDGERDGAGQDTADPRWLRADRLAAMLVPAAIGGDKGAAAALEAWSARAGTKHDKLVRRIITTRLENRSAAHPELLEYLIRDAHIEDDGEHVHGALTKLLGADGTVPEEFLDPLAELVSRLLQHKDPARRRYGYAIAASAVHGRGVAGTRIVSSLGRERDLVVAKAAMNLVDATLANDAGRWHTRADFARLDRALAQLAKPGAAPDPVVGQRARAARCKLSCRCGPLHTPADRTRTAARVWELIREACDPELFGVAGHLLSRMAAVAPLDAGALLVDASTIVHATDMAESTNSWKSTVARRWRRPIGEIMAAIPYGAWRSTVTALADCDPQIFTQAIEASMRHRSEEGAARHIRDLLVAMGADQRAHAVFTAARTRRQRIVGGTSGWPELVPVWIGAVARLARR